MARSRFSFTGEVWEHDGPAAWHFVSLPEAVADEIEATYGHRAGGFGSLRVEVTIGKTRWSTSVFPDRKRGTYLLPLRSRSGSLSGCSPARRRKSASWLEDR